MKTYSNTYIAVCFDGTAAIIREAYINISLEYTAIKCTAIFK
jgi:hypothetical protein